MLTSKYIKLAAAILLALLSKITNAQEAKIYFEKIAQISNSKYTAGSIYKSLDSLMHTRMPSRSYITLQLNRTIDAGFNNQRILLCLNDTDYQLDLLTRNDSVHYSITATAIGFKGFDSYNNRLIKADTAATMRFLNMHNTLYRSNKNLNDLSKELSFEEQYAFYCGDGLPKTKKGKEIEKLAKNQSSMRLRKMLQSICCETQAYGVAGFKMLIKMGHPIAKPDLHMIKHITSRNTELITCSGCFSGIVTKIYP